MAFESTAGKRHRAQEQVRRARLQDFLESLEREDWSEDENEALPQRLSQEASESVSVTTTASSSQKTGRRAKRKANHTTDEVGAPIEAEALQLPSNDPSVKRADGAELESRLAAFPETEDTRTSYWSLSQLARLNVRYPWLAQRGIQEGWLFFTSAPAEQSQRPPRHLCDVCGYEACYTCTRCGAFTCSLGCTRTHHETRCLRSWQP